MAKDVYLSQVQPVLALGKYEVTPLVVPEGKYKPIRLSDNGSMITEAGGRVSTANSSAVALGIGGVFTGAWEDITNCAMVIVTIKTDKASATDGLVVQFSSDGVNIDNTDEFTIPANNGKTFSFNPACKYFRVVYTNGAVAQTYMRLQSICKSVYAKPSSHRINDSITTQEDAELVKSVISAEDETGSFVNIRATQGARGNNMRVSVDQVEVTTNSLKTITYSHAELHSGDHYFSKQTFILASGAAKNILIVTPNTTRWAHMIFGASGETGEIQIDIYEGTTTSDNGTRDNERNRNRNFADNNTTLIYENPTITGNGVLLISQTFGASKTTGGGGRDAEEILLKQNTKYLFKITNNTVSNNKINTQIDWYEHTNLT